MTAYLSQPLCSRLARATLLLLVAASLSVSGCSRGKPKNKVSGTVTLTGGEAVMGTVVFIGEGKEAEGPITDGKYVVTNAPLGKCKVIVKSAMGDVGALAGGGG